MRGLSVMEFSTPYAEFHVFRRAGRQGDPNTLCEVIMRTDVQCVGLKASAADTARRMREQDVGFMPVCDRSGKVLGTITDRDITLRLVAEDLPADTMVERIMSHEVVSCGAQEDIAKAQELMARHRKSRIMCVDEAGRLEGIISQSDIAKMKGMNGALRGITPPPRANERSTRAPVP
jgi:CBS-domain-containing membrane protein